MKTRIIISFGILLALFASFVRWDEWRTVRHMERHLTARAEILTDDLWYLNVEEAGIKLDRIIRSEELLKATITHRNGEKFIERQIDHLHFGPFEDQLWQWGLIGPHEVSIGIQHGGELLGHLHVVWFDHTLTTHIYLLFLATFLAAIIWYHFQLRNNYHRLRETSLALEATDRELRLAHEELETRIKERTTELTKAYEDLLHEIHTRRKTEDDLRKAKDAAEAANRAKDEFLANMSHEIRTPLHAIIGFSSLLYDSQLDDHQRKWSEIVKRRGEDLLAIINDILDLAKIEADHLELATQLFPLRELVSGVCDSFSFQIKSSQMRFSWEIEAAVPDSLIGDPLRLKQILTNLLSNSFKFTEEGEVRLSVAYASRSAKADSVQDTANKTPSLSKRSTQTTSSHDVGTVQPPPPPETIWLLFTILDTGIGIPPEKHDIIFEPFTQVDGSSTRKYGGTGLGLAICKRLVSKMRGKIWVESAPGKGSIFRFTAAFDRSV